MRLDEARTMSDDLTWVSMSRRQPDDCQLVYARAKHGTAQSVVFYANPRRWIGANIVYQFEYFIEWAPVQVGTHALEKTG
jgi:hypothetical protein